MVNEHSDPQSIHRGGPANIGPDSVITNSTLEAVWVALDAVKDPEIPVVSVVELGLIRQVAAEQGRVIVTMTPSFIGCPAVEVMQRAIAAALEGVGFERPEVRMTHRPPWSSDWITSEGRRKLKQFGLAPPPLHAGALETALEQAAICPYCESDQTELKNSFGSTLCRSIYVCQNCRQPFEQFKPL